MSQILTSDEAYKRGYAYAYFADDAATRPRDSELAQAWRRGRDAGESDLRDEEWLNKLSEEEATDERVLGHVAF